MSGKSPYAVINRYSTEQCANTLCHREVGGAMQFVQYSTCDTETIVVLHLCLKCGMALGAASHLRVNRSAET